MGLLKRLGDIVENCGKEYRRQKEEPAPFFECTEQIGERRPPFSGNLLALGDNRDFMRFLLKEKNMEGKFQLIYIDPPFFSRADYAAEIKISQDKLKLPAMKQRAYYDTWENGMEEYLAMLASRLLLMRELLAEDGGIWVHLDWHAVHYVKVIMDEIFGEKNFINEIIWNYKSGGAGKRRFARKHDTLLYYGKTKSYFFAPGTEKSYNRGNRPYLFKGVKEYKDDAGWYTMVNKKDVWRIDMVGRTSGERTGYATQKPELLLEQILESCTREGDLCGDFFSGSGTLAAAAEKMGRRWICCDIGLLAVAGSKRRLARKNAAFSCLYPAGMGRPFAGTGKISAEVCVKDCPITSEKLLAIELVGYKPQALSKLPIGERQKKAVREIARKNPLELVDFWTVDFHYDGEVYRPEVFLYREGKELMVYCEKLLRAPGAVGIKVYDVFGGSGFYAAQVE